MVPDFNFKYFKIIPLFILVVFFYLASEKLIAMTIEYFNSENIQYFRFAPFTILLATLFSLLDKNLHKAPFLWRLIMKVPLLRGTYIGKVFYNFKREDREKNCKFVITQTISKIKVDCYFWDEDENGKVLSTNQTESESIVEDIQLKENGLYELLFYYRQKGNQDSSIPIREGFNSLTYKKTKYAKRLEGIYFVKNGKSKGNGGKISVDYKTNELNHI